ncbi:MAG: thioredoxin family protein [Verrucomicrobiales bacterium]|nr:thioredoxin family protein [Verrucomicrobiales bacterium]
MPLASNRDLQAVDPVDSGTVPVSSPMPRDLRTRRAVDHRLTSVPAVIARLFHPHITAILLAVAFLITACSTPSKPGAGAPIFDNPIPNESRIDHALVEAVLFQRRVLLVFGADWCSDSRRMAARLTRDPRLAPWIDENFLVTYIDVGPRHGPLWDAPVVEAYGRPFEDRGIPALVVLDTDGRQLTHQDNNPLHDSDHRRPRRIRAFLEAWAPAP